MGSFLNRGLKHWLCAAVLLVALPPSVTLADDRLALNLVVAQVTSGTGEDFDIGLKQIPAAGWHTYWQNPGETGLATEITWDLPPGLAASPIQWPTPQRLDYSGLVTYGYDRPSTLITHLHTDRKLPEGTRLPVTAHVASLVCREVCEPVTADLSLQVIVGDGRSTSQSAGAIAGEKALRDTVDSLPKASDLVASARVADGIVTIDITPRKGTARPQLSTAKLHDLYFFSESEDLVAPSSLQTFTRLPSGLRLTAKAGGTAWPDGAVWGVLKVDKRQAYRVKVSAASPLAKASPSPGPLNLGALLAAAGLAFLGGLVLNLMPCVFPILSMKLLALTRTGHDKSAARHESFLYGLGVLLSFLAFAGGLEVARQLGQALGWGFQMQSPFVTAALSLLLMLVALNMSGLFEVGGRLQSLAGSIGTGREPAHPYAGAFLTGILAVVVAAPCTAPFMATAIGVALAQGGLTSFAIFTALAIGFAAPFVVMAHVLTLIPAVTRYMPKPGPWMDRLRHALAVPMYAAVLWMLWVFAQQVSALGLISLMLALLLIGLTLVCLRTRRWMAIGGTLAGLGLGVVAAWQPAGLGTGSASLATAPYIAFSAPKLNALVNQGTPVLVDLTAAWCVTCKVNERTALSDARVLSALKLTGTVYMVGDWTRQDGGITAYLRTFGRSGVPLYVFYKPGQPPVILPQVLDARKLSAVMTGAPGAI